MQIEFQTPETTILNVMLDARGENQPITDTHVIDERLSRR